MEKIKFNFDDEIKLENATIAEVLEHAAAGDTVFIQFNEQLFDELKENMADEYKAAYEENKKDMVGFEVGIWEEEGKITFEW